MQAIDLRNWLTPSQVARRLGLSTEMVRQYCRQGKLVVAWTAHGRLIDPESVERLAREREQERGAAIETTHHSR